MRSVCRLRAHRPPGKSEPVNRGVPWGRNTAARAEPLLLVGCKEVKDREADIPPQGKIRIPDSQPEPAAWRSKFEAAKVGGNGQGQARRGGWGAVRHGIAPRG